MGKGVEMRKAFRLQPLGAVVTIGVREGVVASIRENLERVRERISRAAQRAGRKPEDVLLVAVSKMVPADRIREGIAAGLSVLGENRVQEAKEKIQALGHGGASWHLVGHLQTNKVKDALALFDLIQSVDRLALAEELDRRARAAGGRVDLLVQVNVAAEATKTGFAPDELRSALEALARLEGLRVRGLMAIPPEPQEPEDSRPYFKTMRTLLETARGWRIPGLDLEALSMGMSADFVIAIEEGATIIRVGTAIFGPRPA